MSTSDAIAIAAACVGAGLTLLAVVIAIASFLGFTVIRDQAKKSAEVVAREEVLKLLEEKSGLGMKIRAEITKRIEEQADQLFSDLALSGAFQNGGPSGEIAKEYPKDEPQ